LIDMGVEPFLVSSSVQAILAQRLMRTVCRDCAKKYSPEEEELTRLNLTREDLKGRQLYRAVGCPNCMNTGYSGRTGIHELLILNEELRALVTKSVDASALKRAAMQHGMTTLREDALGRAMKGQTTLEEVLLVTQEDVKRAA
jgi:general secretion pathway protein E